MTKVAIDPFVLSFEEQSLRNKKKRYHWMISLTEKPDFLVSWGHAPTQEVAEEKAIKELESLASGLTQGGQVVTQFTRRSSWTPVRSAVRNEGEMK